MNCSNYQFLEERQPDAGFLMWSFVIVLVTAGINTIPNYLFLMPFVWQARKVEGRIGVPILKKLDFRAYSCLVERIRAPNKLSNIFKIAPQNSQVFRF